MIIIKKSIFKAILDLIMTVLLVLMFDKMVLGLKFHEIGGLVVIVLFLVHLIGNWKWIISVSKNLFNKNIPIKTKVNYIINVLLFIDAIIILVTGILISKIVFKSFGLPNIGMAKFLHFFSSALFIILAGAHIGLHWQWIVAIFKKIFKIPLTFKLNKILTIISVTAILILGVGNMVNSKFSMWLKSPFSYQNMQKEENSQNEQSQHSQKQNEQNQNEQNQNKQSSNKTNQKRETQKSRQEKQGSSTEGIDIIKVITTSLKFISIISIFSVISYYLKKLFLRE